MKRLKQPVILNSQGKPILLTAREKNHAAWMQRQINEKFGNDLGYEVNVTTLTTISKKISEQKFFEIQPSEFMPVVVGEGMWGTNLTTYRSFTASGEFEEGIINNGGQNSRLATANAAVDSLNIKIYPWAKSVGWNIFELEQAARSGNWSLVEALEKARKKDWDLGIQRIAFLGAKGLNSAGGTCLGFLNQPGVITRTDIITQPISKMSTTDLKQFCAIVVEAYRDNCARTAYPDLFTIPESDYNGLAAQASADFPIKSTLQVLEEMFQVITRNKGFKILPLAYADKSISGFSKQRYVLSRYDEESGKLNIPLRYTSTLANSLDNFSFQNAAYGQFTGYQVLRPLEMLYLDF